VSEPSLLDMIRNRHPSPGWVTIAEMPNSTGTGASRRLDAVSLGVWPSNGFTLHGFEIKVERSDVKRELAQPSKADAIARFCDYFWLVVPDMAIVADLVIPENWGILAPQRGTLYAKRKAAKLDASPFTRGFAAAMLRKVVVEWVSKEDHEKLHADIERRVAERVKQHLERNMDYEQRALLNKVRDFKEHSGIDLEAAEPYQIDNIAEAVKVVMEARQLARSKGKFRIDQEPAMLVRREIESLEENVKRHRTAVSGLNAAIASLTAMADGLEPEPAPAPCDTSPMAEA
jgi:hypothetical protein